jgi:hypothetical protein
LEKWRKGRIGKSRQGNHRRGWRRRKREWSWHRRAHLKHLKRMQNNTPIRVIDTLRTKNRQISIISTSLRMLPTSRNNTIVNHQQMKMKTPKLPMKGTTYNNSTHSLIRRSLRMIKQHSK